MTFQDVAHGTRSGSRAGRVAVNTERVGPNLDDFASGRRCLALFGKAHGLRGRDIQVLVYGTGFLSRYERAVRLIRPCLLYTSDAADEDCLVLISVVAVSL